jgi:hypothetical protein
VARVKGEVTIVIPWREDRLEQPEREAAVVWVTARNAEPGRVVHIAMREDRPAEWSKAAAICAASELIGREGIVVVTDADVWSPGLNAAIAAVRAGYPWAMPHMRVHRLTPEATQAVLEGAEPDESMPCVKRPYRGVCGGGIVVLPAATLAEVPPDRRFRGWGSEDRAWCDTLRALAGQEWRRTNAPLFHLWHPPYVSDDGVHITSPENAALAAEYARHRHDGNRLRAMLDASRATA